MYFNSSLKLMAALKHAKISLNVQYTNIVWMCLKIFLIPRPDIWCRIINLLLIGNMKLHLDKSKPEKMGTFIAGVKLPPPWPEKLFESAFFFMAETASYVHISVYPL